MLAMLSAVAFALLAFASFLHLRRVLMRHRLILAALTAASVSLASCGTLGALSSPGQGAEARAIVHDVLTDPNCGHEDQISIVLGPVPSGSVVLRRTCGPAPKPRTQPNN